VDRLGSVYQGSNTSYVPYGEERTPTTQDMPKFGTYERGASGLDYAVNRHYSSTWGRFTSADPYQASAALTNPQSWNRYAYVQGDPVNARDPLGLASEDIGDDFSDGQGSLPSVEGPWISLPVLWPSELFPMLQAERDRIGRIGPSYWYFVATCGVNPVSRLPGIYAASSGYPGELRPGDAGRYHAIHTDRTHSWPHAGIDISGVTGVSPVYASLGGTVLKAEDTHGNPGMMVTIDIGVGFRMNYMHLASISVKVGDKLTMGQQLGILGQTGNAKGQAATEAHVHFEIKNAAGSEFDPVRWLNTACLPSIPMENQRW
jgi:RHS repeat-associated protein